MLMRVLLFLFALCLFFGCSQETTKPPEEPPVEPPGLPPTVHDRWASWAPDGQYIFYQHQAEDSLEISRHGQYSIWGYDTRSGGHGFLVGPGMFPKSNPDGSILAFAWGRTLFFYYFDSKGVRQVTDGLEVYTFNWAPDGRSLVLSDYDGRVIDTLGNLYAHLLPWDGSNSGWRGMGDGKWASDGARLLVTSADMFGYFGIIIIDTLGTVLDTIAVGKYPSDTFGYPSWSPDESRILVNFAYTQRGRSLGDFRIYRAEGTLERILTTNGGAGEWSPDGTKIVFQRFTWMANIPAPEPMEYGRVTLWLCNPDGSDMHELMGWPLPPLDPDMFDGGYNWVTDTHRP
jgi:Tol biopolymer transport system component